MCISVLSRDQIKEGKPERHLLDAKEATFGDVIDLFRKLTGREPTPEEIEEARREWESGDG
jgi:hypothetical protein